MLLRADPSLSAFVRVDGARPVLVDMRNIYDANTMRGLGFAYTGVGV